jgi:hypothetical protein
MSFSPNVLWKHEKMRDIAMEVRKKFLVEGNTYDRWLLHITWWRLSTYRPPYPMGFHEKIEIPVSKVREWLPVLPASHRKDIKELRYEVKLESEVDSCDI